MKGLSKTREGRRIMELQGRQDSKMPMNDEKIVDLYWARDEKAIEETDLKYRKYLYTVAYNIVHDRLDSEECLNDTYLGAWHAMPPSRPNALKAFLTVIARRIAVKRYHGSLRHSEMMVALAELEDFIKGDGDVDADFDARRLGEVISGFVRTLSPRKQFIFMSRYYTADPIDEIAKDLRVSRSTVNKELFAIRSVLKVKLESEGYFI